MAFPLGATHLRTSRLLPLSAYSFQNSDVAAFVWRPLVLIQLKISSYFKDLIACRYKKSSSARFTLG